MAAVAVGAVVAVGTAAVAAVVAVGLSGRLYLYGALVLGLLYLAASFVAAFSSTRQDARRLLLASVLYLPLLFGLMIVNS